MRRFAFVLLGVLALILTTADSTFPQIPSSAINGRITDSSDAAIAGASVRLTQKQTGVARVTETEQDGRYQFDNLAPSDYEIEVLSPGFSSELYDVPLRVGDHPTVNFRLEVSRLNESVDVRVEISGINTTDSRIDGSVSRLQIENLPLNGLNFLELARLEPGVQMASVANPGGFGNNYQRVSIAGARYLETRVSVDGATVRDWINGGTSQNFSKETVQEFQISTFGFDVSTGTTGAGAINVMTRQGGNNVHGSMFFYYRDSDLDAYPALSRDLLDPSPHFARRQSGFSLGGPIERNRFFWFTNYEHNNQDGVFAVANNHPVFSKLDVVHPSSLNFNLFNQRFDASINNKHSAFVRWSSDRNDTMAPVSAGAFMPSNWTVSRSRSAQVQVAVTSTFTPRFISDTRFSYGSLNNRLDPVTTLECSAKPACVGVEGPEIRIFDAPAVRIGHQATAPKTMDTRSYRVVNNVTWQSSVQRLHFGGEWEHLVLNSVHSFYEKPQITLWGPTDLQSRGLTSLFNALPESLRIAGSKPPTQEDLLRLPLRSFIIGVGNPLLPGPYNHDEAAKPDVLRFHIQGSSRIRSNVTLSYGLAYLRRSQIFNQDLARPSYLAPVLNGDLQPPHLGVNTFEPRLGLAWSFGRASDTVVRAGAGLYHDELSFFVPFLERARLGPSGNGRVQVDGAVAGLSFMSTPTDFSGHDLLSVLPGIQSSLQAKFGDGGDPSVTGIEVLKQGDRIFDADHTVPAAIHLNFGIQRKLSNNIVLSADYVTRRLENFGGFHSLSQLDRNRFNRPRVTGVDPNTGAVSFVRDPVIPLCTSAQAAALNPMDLCSTGPVNVYGSDAGFRYHGLHTRLEKRFSAGFQLTASYALASNTGFVEMVKYDQLESAYGNLPDHRKHRITLSGVYSLPRYNGSSRRLQALLNNWTASFIVETDSAPPLNTMLAGLDLDGDGISRTLLPGITKHNTLGAGVNQSELRNLVAQYNESVETRTRLVTNADGSTTLIRPRTPFNQVINPITLPPSFSSGDSFLTQDLRLTRRFSIRETANLLLIGEVFNLFNVSNLTGYSNMLDQVNYGQPSARAGQVFGSGGPRAFQFAARLEF
jgi:hypothetical protein